MRNKDFEVQMRLGECYHTLRVPPGAWIVVRVDGRGFSRLTKRLRIRKPFDPAFHSMMVDTATHLFRSMQSVYAYTESDEISVVLPPDTNLYGRKVEKLVSIAAASASGAMSIALGSQVEFDGRVWVGADRDAVADYMRWRQSDAVRCCFNGHAYWALWQAGASGAAAASRLVGMTASNKLTLLREHGIEFDSLPGWQRHGVGIFWESFIKQGRNPIDGVSVEVRRRRIRTESELPYGDNYTNMVHDVLLCAERERRG